MKILIYIFFSVIFSLNIKAQTNTLLCDAKADTNYLKALPWYTNTFLHVK